MAFLLIWALEGIWAFSRPWYKKNKNVYKLKRCFLKSLDTLKILVGVGRWRGCGPYVVKANKKEATFLDSPFSKC
jgi:hypothetical protein